MKRVIVSGVYCLGPTSLKAVKYGELYLPYDGPFVFAEVNADRLVWMVLKDGTFDLKRTISHRLLLSSSFFFVSNLITILFLSNCFTYALTLSQATDFRLFKTDRVCR